MTPFRPFLTEMSFSVQTYDIDFAGVVSNQVYIRWLEDLRLRMLEIHWPLDKQLRDGYAPFLLSTKIEYLHAVRLFDRLAGTMWLSDLGRVRFTMQAEFIVNERIAARASHVVAFIRTSTFRPLPIPAGLRERFLAAARTE